MIDVLSFLYEYYQFYFYLITGLLGSVANLLNNKHYNNSSERNTFLYLLVFLADCFVATFLRKVFYPFFVFSFIKSDTVAIIVTFCLKEVFAFAFGFLIVALINLFLSVCQKVLKSSYFNDNKYGIIIFTYLFISMLVEWPTSVNSWGALWYATDYSMGIGPRFFIGTFLKLFYSDFLEEKTVVNFCNTNTLLIIFCSSVILNELINKTSKKLKAIIFFLVVLFLSSPGSISGMWQKGNNGRFENYGLLLSLVSIIVFKCLKNIRIKYLIITVFSCLSIAIYQGNIFMYYPMILMLIAYDCLYDEENKNKKISIKYGLFNIISTSIFFLFFQFCSYTYFPSASSMAEFLSKKTNLPITEMAIDYELFKPLSSAFENISIPFIAGDEDPRTKTILTLLILFPIAFVVLYLYLECFKYRKKYKMMICEMPYFVFLSLSLCIIPQFLLNVDWGRWMVCVNIVLFTGVFYLIYKKDKGMLNALDGLYTLFIEHKTIFIFAVVFIAGLSKFEGRGFLIEVDKLFNMILSIVHFS